MTTYYKIKGKEEEGHIYFYSGQYSDWSVCGHYMGPSFSLLTEPTKTNLCKRCLKWEEEQDEENQDTKS
jgi:hypothetical protein